MDIAVVTGNYPSDDNIYSNMFVHRRCYEYQQKGHNVTVFLPREQSGNYKFDGVQVLKGDSDKINQALKLFDVVCVHLLPMKPFTKKSGLKIFKYIIENNKPLLWFFHGDESLKSSYYHENYSLKGVYRDYVTLNLTRYLVKSLKKHNTNHMIIYPSGWFSRESQKLLGLDIINSKVIPNGVDLDKFKFRNDKFSKRHKILSIRSFNMKKYANDIAIKTMYYLPEHKLTIYGKGKYLSQCMDMAKKYGIKNVKFRTRFLAHNEIPIIHNNYGIYLSPSRMDTQGVSMCEAMASGFPVVSTKVCAIPEYVDDGVNGRLVDLHKDDWVTAYYLAEEIKDLCSDKKVFDNMSANANKSMERIEKDSVIKWDLKIMDLIRAR